MYQKYFGFKEAPFSLTPDTQFFLNQQSHCEALNTLLVALKHSEGFIKIVGEVGTGKTLLCRILLSRLSSTFVPVYISNPYLTPEELKALIAEEIGAEYQAAMPAHVVMSVLRTRLLNLFENGKQVVLVVDEAQAMPRETIECLRLLTNLETEKRKLLQVVVVGQPELDALLARPDLRQLKQRIIFSETLKPFDKSGVSDYVIHRLESAGFKNARKRVSHIALWLIAEGSGGIPRLINILTHKALICAYGKGEEGLKALHVARAIADTEESKLWGKVFTWHYRFLRPAAVSW